MSHRMNTIVATGKICYKYMEYLREILVLRKALCNFAAKGFMMLFSSVSSRVFYGAIFMKDCISTSSALYTRMW